MADMEDVFDENIEHLTDEDCTTLLTVVPCVARKPRRSSKKPKVVSEWSETEVFKLISCVQEHSALWDTRDSQYRNKHERSKLWDEISENEFYSKFEGAELVAKWSNLRIQFRSYAAKKRKSGQATPPPIYWKFYAAMQFIASTESNLNNEESDSSNSNIPVSRIFPTPRFSRKRRLSVSTVASISSTTTPHSAALAVADMKAVVESFNQSKQQQQQQHSDEFEAFGKFLASELRSLDDIAMARRIKHKLNRYFLDVLDEEL